MRVTVALPLLILLTLQAHTAEGLTLSFVTGLKGGNGVDQLRDATGLSVAADGFIYVADTGNHRVQRCKLGSTACVTVAGGTRGPAANQLNSPYAISVTAGSRQWIVDTANHRVQRYDLNATVGVTVAGGDGSLSFPSSITFDEARRQFYIADTGNQRIVRYQLDDNFLVSGTGVTVAGVAGSTSDPSDYTRLNNPTSIFFDASEDKLWVADARNYRIMWWDYGSVSGDGGNVGIAGLSGKPYGVVVSGGALYWSDYDRCIVWKRLIDIGAQEMIAGGSCGVALNSLTYPGALHVTQDGALFVADSGNSRVLRFGPEPSAVSVECWLSQSCAITLSDGNPTTGNLLVVINARDGGGCGKTCSVAPISGGNWTNHPRGVAPFLRTSVHNFGYAKVAAITDYVMCWGSAVTDEQIKEIKAGNCSLVKRTLGRLKMNTYIESDLDANRVTSQCVKGAGCEIVIKGYSIPNGTTILAAPGSGQGTNFRCAGLGGSTFTGFRDFVLFNPGVSVPVQWPYESEGDLSTEMTVDMGLGLGSGTRNLCLCYGGISCNQPVLFKIDAGMVSMRASRGSEMYTCYYGFGGNCTFRVRGKFLQSTDKIALAKIGEDCRKTLELNGDGVLPVTLLPFVSPLVGAFDATPLSTDAHNEDFDTDFNIGEALYDGRYKVCYCASYDGDDTNDTTCDNGFEYTQEAGTLEVFRVRPEHFECAVGRPCTIVAEGTELRSTDRMIVDLGDASICSVIAIYQENATTGNIFAPANATVGANHSILEYYLRTFATAGERFACYCASFDTNDGITCNFELEFYQEMASVTVRGPKIEVRSCYQDQNCSVVVQGFQLSEDDVLMVCPLTTRCQYSDVCTSVGPQANSGILSPRNATASWSQWDLGIIPVGSVSLCYCAPGRDPNHTSAIPCEEASDLTMYAGEVRVKGVTSGQLYSCVAGQPCTVVISGFALSNTDYVLIAPLDSVCGSTDGVLPGLFAPARVMRTKKDDFSTTTRPFLFENATTGGRYRVCYCPSSSCAASTDFKINAGLLFVKDVITRAKEARCILGDNCTFRTTGFGLNEVLDSAMLVPKNLGCGGEFVLVRGAVPADPSNKSAVTLDGTYKRLALTSEGRVQFQSLEYQQLMYYNTYWSRWMLGPRKDPDVPEEPGFAWVGGLNAYYPDRFTDLPWKVWDAGTKSWTAWPSLEVVGAIAPDGTFELNPTNEKAGRVEDTALGPPYVLAETFSAGVAERKGLFRICICPAADFGDIDEVACTSEDEHLVGDGFLEVGVVRGDERYHCALNGKCIVRTAIPEDYGRAVAAANVTGGVLRALLIPGGKGCFQVEMYGRLADAVNGSWLAGEAVFDLGMANISGDFEICVCTAYDVDDGIPCNNIHEFFEHPGNLTVAPFYRRSFSNGEVRINLTRGSGLAHTDYLLLVEEDNCNNPVIGSFVSKASSVGPNGSWAVFVFNSTIASGSLSACLCPSFDGADPDAIACSSGSEFRSLVGRITLSVVTPPRLRTTATSIMELELDVKSVASSSARRLARPTASVWDGSAGALTNLQFISLFEFSMADAIATSLNLASVNISKFAVSVKVNTLEAWPKPTSTGSKRIRALVGFTATYTAEPAYLLRSVCPFPAVIAYITADVLDPLSEPTATEYGQCLAVAMAFNELGDGTLINFRAAMYAEAVIMGIPLLNVDTVFLDVAARLGAVAKPPEFTCAQSAECQAFVTSPQSLLRGGAVLVLDGASAACGSLSVDAGMSMTAEERASHTFGGGDSGTGVARLAPMAATTLLRVPMGTPASAGEYTLCYCMAMDASQCVYDKQFDQLAGILTVRGIAATQPPTDCVAWATCNASMFGTYLTPLDRLRVVPESESCGNATGSIVPTIEVNPSLDPVVPPLTEFWVSQRFSLGMSVEVGSYRLCYCAAYDGALYGFPSAVMPCTTAEQYTIDAGLLWVRGIDLPDFQLRVARSDKAIAPTTLFLHGRGLLPGLDKVLLVPWELGRCGAGAVVPEDLAPNPAPVRSVGALTPWSTRLATDQVEFTIEQATKVGDYRICFCTESPITRCGLVTSFLHQAGMLRVRGATGGQLFVCREGLPCTLEVVGVGLSAGDFVSIVPEDTSCGFGELDVGLSLGGPFQPSSVGENGTNATFDIGALVLVTKAESYRVCYCADLNADGEGSACSNSTDYAHSAGIINTVVCPSDPGYVDFVPPVEDVFQYDSLVDDPRVSLWTVEAQACGGPYERSATNNVQFSAQFPPSGAAATNASVYISTAAYRCNASVVALTAKMQSAEFLGLKLQTLDPFGGLTSIPIPLSMGPKLRVTPSVMDTQGHYLVCPAWQVRYVSFACDWTGALHYFVILHLAFCTAGLLLFLSLNAELLGSFMDGFKKRVLRKIRGDKPKKKKDDGQSLADNIRSGLTFIVDHSPQMLVTTFRRNCKAWRLLDRSFLEADPKPPDETPAAARKDDGMAALKSVQELDQQRRRGDMILGMLAGTWWPMFLALARVGVFIIHLIILSVIKVETLSAITLFLVPGVCIVVAGGMQLAVIAATMGRDGLVPILVGSRKMPVIYSIIAVSKLHLDLSLPLLLRKHHCELWRHALPLFWIAVVVQLFIPVLHYFLALLPPRRSMPPWARKAAVNLMLLPEQSQVLLEPAVLTTTATKAATSPVKGKKQGEAAEVLPGEVALSLEDERGMLDTSGWNYFLECMTRRLRWNSVLLSAPFMPAPPEQLQRRRLIALYAFMDASGWHIATSMCRDVIQRSTGLELVHLEARTATFAIIFGGLDLAAMHAFLLYCYYSRLSFTEALILAISLSVGVLQASRPNIGRASFELAARWVRKERITDAIAWFAFFLGLRFVLALPLSSGCPDFAYLFILASISVLFVELPVFAYCYPRLNPHLLTKRQQAEKIAIIPKARPRHWWQRCWGRHKSGTVSASAPGGGGPLAIGDAQSPLAIGDGSPGNRPESRPGSRGSRASRGMPGDGGALFTKRSPAPLGGLELPSPGVLKFPGSEPIITATFRLIEALSEEVRAALVSDAEAPLRRLQRATSRLYYDPPPKRGLEAREQRLLAACMALRSIAEGLRKESRPCRMAYDELRALCDQELKLARMAIRCRRLADSYHFADATLKSRAEVIAAALPEAPQVWLVHWRTLKSIGRLPDPDEKEFLTTATSAYVEYGAQAVLVPAIHRARSASDPDPHRVTCRQLLTFAQWYRLQWGTDVEVFFWIDCCCLPELAGIGKDDEGTSAVLKADPLNMLNAVARRGLMTLPVWIEQQPRHIFLPSPSPGVVTTPGLTPSGTKELDDTPTVSQGGADAMLPLIFAAADAIVVCESRGFERSSWVRLHFALAHCYAPSVKNIYLLDRRLVHVPKAIRHPKEEDRPPLIATVNSEHADGLPSYKNWQVRVANDALVDADDFDDEMDYSSRMTGTGLGFHPVAGATGASFFSQRPDAPKELAVASAARVESYILQDPRDWPNVLLDRPEQDRSRIARLTAQCLEFPTLATAGGYRRPIFKIGESYVRVCRIEPEHPKRPKAHATAVGGPARPKVGNDGVVDSSSESSEEEVEVVEADGMEDDAIHGRLGAALKAQRLYHAIKKPEDTAGEPETSPVFAFTEVKYKGPPTASMWRRGGASKESPGPTAEAVDMFLRRAADVGPQVQVVGGAFLKPKAPPKGRPDPENLFHQVFHPRTVQISGFGRTAEQIRPMNVTKVPLGMAAASAPSGGFAILAKPLEPRRGVAPDVDTAMGVFFSVTVEECDSAWEDGLGIGFTTQDPDNWPKHRVNPRYAPSLPGTYLCGYSGRWVLDGHSDIIRNVRGSSLAWTPQSLRRGDVVTAVLAARPADVFRVLVNGRVVAERSASDLPDASSDRLWGIVDVDGCCVKVRLGEKLPWGDEAAQPDLGDLAKTLGASDRFARTS